MPKTRPASLQLGQEKTVYLLCLDERVSNRARHYIGYTKLLARRLRQHGTSNGAALLRYAREAGIGWKLARAWRGTQALEYRLKDWNNSSFLCPRCAGERRRRVSPARFAEEVFRWDARSAVRVTGNKIYKRRANAPEPKRKRKEEIIF